jgi:Leucine-rich repeat (LRR) protein
VEGVSKNGPAESAALREGDQMVCINGLAVCDMEHSVVVEHFQSCDNVKLLYIPSKYLESSSVRITKQNGSAASYLWAFVKQLHSVEIINIDLSANGKSGRTKIPLSGLNSLRHLSMNHCSLSSLDCLEGLNMLHKLESLSLAHNLLDSEAITRGIATLVQLKKLNLSHNLLNRVPPIISSLKLLESLILANNNIAELPVSLLKLERLQTLCLNGNLLCDIDTLLLHMPQVRNLTLTNNSLDCEVQIARTKDFRIAGIVSIVTLLSPLSCFRTWDLHNVTY